VIDYPELTPLVIGTSRDYTLQVPAADGSLYTIANTPFNGSEAMAAQVSLGVDQPALLAPAIAWQSTSGGGPQSGWQTATFVVSFEDGDAVGLVPGEYVLLCTANYGGRTARLFVGYLPLIQTSGTASAPTTYGSLDDMRIYFAGIDRLEHPSRRSQFIRERNRARTWFDLLMQRHFRASGYGISTIGYPIGGIGPYRTGGINTWLQQQLDANTLMVTDDIREVVAKKALAFTLEYQFGGVQETSYQALADRLHWEADNLAIQTTPGLDLSGSGWPELVLDLSTADTLMA
jgi:hypothetical protein